VPVIHITRLSWTRIEAEIRVTTFYSLCVVKVINELVKDTVTGRNVNKHREKTLDILDG